MRSTRTTTKRRKSICFSPRRGGDGLHTKGVVGLGNLGNTCFMNSALQCITKTEVLKDFFLNDKHLNEINGDNPLGYGGKVAEAFAKLMKGMWYGDSQIIRPSEFKRTIGRCSEQFSGYEQNCSGQFMMFLLDAIHEDLNRVKIRKRERRTRISKSNGEDLHTASQAWEDNKGVNDSIIVDNFQGQTKITTYCSECDDSYSVFDQFMYLQVPIPKPANSILLHYVCGCFKNFEKDLFLDLLKDFNYAQCEILKEYTNKEEIGKEEFKLSFSSSKELLMSVFEKFRDKFKDLHLIKKRFGYDLSNFSKCFNSYKKNTPFKLYFLDRNIIEEIEIRYDDPPNTTQKTFSNKLELRVIFSNELLKYFCEEKLYQKTPKFTTDNPTLSLNDCIKEYCKTRVFDQVRCGLCKKKVFGKVNISLWRLPEVLIVQIKRFKSVNGRKKKLYHFVDFDQTMMINDNVYELYAVCNHMGSLNGGHYTTFAKVKTNWYEFDDSFVEKISERKIVSKYAYLLFYELKKGKYLSTENIKRSIGKPYHIPPKSPVMNSGTILKKIFCSIELLMRVIEKANQISKTNYYYHKSDVQLILDMTFNLEELEKKRILQLIRENLYELGKNFHEKVQFTVNTNWQFFAEKLLCNDMRFFLFAKSDSDDRNFRKCVGQIPKFRNGMLIFMIKNGKISMSENFDTTRGQIVFQNDDSLYVVQFWNSPDLEESVKMIKTMIQDIVVTREFEEKKKSIFYGKIALKDDSSSFGEKFEAMIDKISFYGQHKTKNSIAPKKKVSRTTKFLKKINSSKIVPVCDNLKFYNCPYYTQQISFRKFGTSITKLPYLFRECFYGREKKDYDI